MDKEKIVYKNRLGQFLKEHPDIKKNIVTQGEGLYMFNMQLEFPSHWEKYDDEIKHELRWYFSICSSGESERILNPNNINDYLLKMRADSILSNIRITRVICKRAEHIEEEKWNLNDQFDDSIIDLFKKEICDIYKQELEGVNYGTLFSDKPNGSCIKNDYGILIVFSEALKMFLYFMNFYFFNYDEIKINIKRETKIKSLLIALRIMTFKESFDFEIDERGEIPLLINNKINEINKYELFFILAHECAHVILGHLNDNIINKYIFYQDIKKNERIEHYYEYSSMKRKEKNMKQIILLLICFVEMMLRNKKCLYYMQLRVWLF